MTVRQAQQKLLKPVFGDESHIDALNIYRRFVTLKQYRDQADEIDMDHLDEFYALRETPEPEDLTVAELENEIYFWQAAQPWGEL